MYKLPYHREDNEQIIKEFILKHPFAYLSGCDAKNRPVATQIPLFREEKEGKKLLKGHLMRNTDHHKAFAQNANVLAVFTGKHSYVSGSWYSNPNSPSTWNYMSVHIKGKIRFLEDDDLEEVLRMTSLHFEDNNPESSTVFDKLPKSFIQKVKPAIVAFEIEESEIDAVFKLSQDRDAQSYRNIIEKLKEKDEDGKVIAAEMERREKGLFPES